jgi:hypothetical protein
MSFVAQVMSYVRGVTSFVDARMNDVGEATSFVGGFMSFVRSPIITDDGAGELRRGGPTQRGTRR